MQNITLAITAGAKLATRSALDLQPLLAEAGYPQAVRYIKGSFADDAQAFARELLAMGIQPVFETTQARETREAIFAELAAL